MLTFCRLIQHDTTPKKIEKNGENKTCWGNGILLGLHPMTQHGQQRHPRFHGSPAGVKVLMSASQRPPTPMTNGTFIPPIDGESLGVDGIVLHLQSNVNR